MVLDLYLITAFCIFEKLIEYIYLFPGVAGMCSKTAVAPLDRIKILLQAHNRHYKHLGYFYFLTCSTEKLW